MEPGLAKVVKKSKNQQAWRPHQTGLELKVAELGVTMGFSLTYDKLPE